ncbi:MAG TPA: TlpA disulfide reductase family protein [Methylocella sp.]|nr:TlpA disulfide reductase family protein [Methylocella sp.]
MLSSGILAVLALGLTLYGIKKTANKEVAPSPECSGAAERTERLKPMVKGEIAALALAEHPSPVPELTFSTPEKSQANLTDFRGRTLLVNFWATWCVPCRQEMPSLDHLQSLRGSKDFEVIAINVDTTKLDRPQAFLNEIGVKNLKLYTDSTASAFESLRRSGELIGLPTTLLVDKEGCEIGSMAGPAQWDSQDALSLLDAIAS